MNIEKRWDELCASLDKVRPLIEELAAQLPASGSAKRIRQSLAAAWDKISDSTEAIDDLLKDSIQPLPVDFPWQDKDFVSKWKIYKEYLKEQHGITMRSRMEGARLRAIKTYCKGDKDVFLRAIDFYMALGSTNIFEVNFETVKKEIQQDERKTYTITLPRE